MRIYRVETVKSRFMKAYPVKLLERIAELVNPIRERYSGKNNLLSLPSDDFRYWKVFFGTMSMYPAVVRADS